MRNKLGLSYSKLSNVERKIVNLKLNLLDEYFTFNKNIFDIKYLEELHNFLFSDIYYEKDLCIKNLTEEEKYIVKIFLDDIKSICLQYSKNQSELLKYIERLWSLQIFQNGNTRTLIAYLKILNKVFLFDLNVDVNKEIISVASTFSENNFVNQKRLTKKK